MWSLRWRPIHVSSSTCWLCVLYDRPTRVETRDSLLCVPKSDVLGRRDTAPVMSATAKKRPKQRRAPGAAPPRQFLGWEPSATLFPSKNEVLKLFAVIGIAASVAAACNYAVCFFNRQAKSFCDSSKVAYDTDTGDLRLFFFWPLNWSLFPWYFFQLSWADLVLWFNLGSYIHFFFIFFSRITFSFDPDEFLGFLRV